MNNGFLTHARARCRFFSSVEIRICVNCECTQIYTATLDACFIYLHKCLACNLATAGAAVDTIRTCISTCMFMKMRFWLVHILLWYGTYYLVRHRIKWKLPKLNRFAKHAWKPFPTRTALTKKSHTYFAGAINRWKEEVFELDQYQSWKVWFSFQKDCSTVNWNEALIRIVCMCVCTVYTVHG